MRIKVRKKNNQLIVKVRLGFRDTVDEQEMNSIMNTYVRGFLKPAFFRRSVIEYAGPTGISLKERLKSPVTQYEFYLIVEQILIATQRVESRNLHPDRLLLDIENIFINEATKELQFIYLPVENIQRDPNVLQFIESMIYLMKPAEGQDSDYISRFMYYITSLSAYDADKIEEYINREDKRIVKLLRPYKSVESAGTREKTNNKKDHAPAPEQEEATDLLEEDTDLLEEEATELTDEESTDLYIDESDGDTTRYPTLERVATGEIIFIDKAVFRLGKEESCVDYAVDNNNMVSRSHADLIIRKQKYYVMDLNSKNRTFINNRVLPVQYEVEIFDGDKLRLANEEFIFRT